MSDKLDNDIIDVLSARHTAMTYVVANWLRSGHREYRFSLKTSQVLRRLKALERSGKVQRVPSVYVVQLCWRLQPNTQ
jgi:hypothetical protein